MVACPRPGAATLTYVYADSMVVVGGLSQYAEPHSYDLCADHATRFIPPRGWNVVHINPEYAEPEPSPDDLDALAQAVREAGKSLNAQPQRPSSPPTAGEPRRGHLRVISSQA